MSHEPYTYVIYAVVRNSNTQPQVSTFTHKNITDCKKLELYDEGIVEMLVINYSTQRLTLLPRTIYWI